jgi:DNA-damage-inducible protein J
MSLQTLLTLAMTLFELQLMSYNYFYLQEHRIMTTTLVRARIDQALKDEAASVLAEMGLTVSDAVRIALTKIAREKALPFDMRIPNRLERISGRAHRAGLAVDLQDRRR